MVYFGFSAGKKPTKVPWFFLRPHGSWYGSALPLRSFGARTTCAVPVLPATDSFASFRRLAVPSFTTAWSARVTVSAVARVQTLFSTEGPYCLSTLPSFSTLSTT